MEIVLRTLFLFYFQKIEPSILKDLIVLNKRPGDLLKELGFIYEIVYDAPKTLVSLTFDDPCLYVRLSKHRYLAYNGKLAFKTNETISRHSVVYEILGMQDCLYTYTKRLYCFSNLDILALLPFTVGLFFDTPLSLLYLGAVIFLFKMKYHIHRHKTKQIFNAYLETSYLSFLNKHVFNFIWFVSIYIIFSFSIYKHPALSMAVFVFLPFRSNRWLFIFGLIMTIDVPLVGITIALFQYPYQTAVLPKTVAYTYLFKNNGIETLSIDGTVLKQGVYLHKDTINTIEINELQVVASSFLRYYDDIYVVDKYHLNPEYFETSSLQKYLHDIGQDHLISYILHLDSCNDRVLEIMMFYELSMHPQKYIFINQPIYFLDASMLMKIFDYLAMTKHTFVLYLPQYYLVENLCNCAIIGDGMR